jgi:hypothetical protein
MQQTKETIKSKSIDTKLSESEFNQIDRELEQFRVKKDSPEQISYFQRFGKDITDNLTKSGEEQWLQLRGGVVIQGDKLGLAVRYRDGKPLLPDLERKLNQYKWLKNLKNKGRLCNKSFQVEEKKEEEINPDDIPF